MRLLVALRDLPGAALPKHPDRIGTVDERERKIGRNEAMFREVNDRIERVSESMHVTDQLAILCECGDSSCTAHIDVSLSEYERIRGDSALFFVCRGHEEPDVEDVVEKRDGSVVVRKKPGGPAELAAELDSRS
jgi:hypothetical protein